MADTKTLIEQAYAAFNSSDIDGALALMAEDVICPKGSEGGNVNGKDEICAYWTRQWKEFNPQFDPLAITIESLARVHVTVRQLVKCLQGDVLSDGQVLHIFTIRSGLIAALNLGDEAGQTAAPSDAFVHRS